MKFSILPPTRGMLTSTEAWNSSRDPVPDFAGTRTAEPASVAGAPVIEPLTVAVACPLRTGAPGLLAHEAQVAAVELGHHTGQPVGTQRLSRHDVDATVLVEDHRIQRVDVGTRIRQPRQPILFVAECPVDLLDVALVFGGHVE